MYITLSTGFVTNQNKPLFDQIDELKKVNCKLFEVHGFPEHIDIRDENFLIKLAEIGRKNDWQFISMHAPAWGGQGRYDLSNPDDSLRNEAINWNKSALRAVKLLGGQYVVIHAGEDVQDPKQRMNRLDLSIQSILELIKLAEELEIIIAVENILPPYLTGNLKELAYLFDKIHSPWVQPIFDVAHAFLTDDLEGWFEFFSKHTCVAVHATDNHGRVKGEHADDEHLFPGEGIIPWSKVLMKMREFGFDGPVTIECPINLKLMPQFTDLVYKK